MMHEHTTDHRVTRRDVLRAGAGIAGSLAVGPMILGACGGSGSGAGKATTTSAAPTDEALGRAVGGPEMLRAAKADGALRTVAVGEEGSFYIPVLKGFTEYSGIEPDISKALYPPQSAVADVEKARTDPPFDVLETSVDWAGVALEKNLVTPYKSSLWDDIPSTFKDPGANWSAAYFGMVSFVSTLAEDEVPATWEQLVEAGKPGSLGMLGNPSEAEESTLAGGLALLTVLSASVANGGSLDDVGPGIDLFKTLSQKGIYAPFGPGGEALPANLAIPGWVGNGSVPIGCLFSFDVASTDFFAKKENLAAISRTPTDGVVGGFYCQSLVTNAENLDAARLWVEYLQSDQGAEQFLKGGAIPTRHAALRSDPGVSGEVKALLPDEALLDKVVIPSASQLAKAQAVVNERWNSEVLGK